MSGRRDWSSRVMREHKQKQGQGQQGDRDEGRDRAGQDEEEEGESKAGRAFVRIYDHSKRTLLNDGHD